MVMEFVKVLNSSREIGKLRETSSELRNMPRKVVCNIFDKLVLLLINVSNLGAAGEDPDSQRKCQKRLPTLKKMKKFEKFPII